MGFAETSAALWRQRELLAGLLYTLEIEALVLGSSRTRWLGTATHDVELALRRVREADILRAILVDEAAEESGLQSGASLAELAAVAGEPWGDVLTEHRTALVALSAEISAAVRENRDRLTAGARAVREALGAARQEDALYGADGRAAAAPVGARFVDEAL